MDAEVNFLSQNTKKRLNCDSSWVTTSVHGFYEYPHETKVLLFHRIFGDILVHFSFTKRQIWTFIGSSEIPYVDDLALSPNIIESKKRLQEFCLRYVNKIIRIRASKL